MASTGMLSGSASPPWVSRSPRHRAVAVAKRPCRTPHRFNSPRMPRPRHRVRRSPPAQNSDSYADYHNRVRTHLSLDKDAPIHRPANRTGRIVAIPILAASITNMFGSDFGRHRSLLRANLQRMVVTRPPQDVSQQPEVPLVLRDLKNKAPRAQSTRKLRAKAVACQSRKPAAIAVEPLRNLIDLGPPNDFTQTARRERPKKSMVAPQQFGFFHWRAVFSSGHEDRGRGFKAVTAHLGISTSTLTAPSIMIDVQNIICQYQSHKTGGMGDTIGRSPAPGHLWRVAMESLPNNGRHRI